MQTSDEDGPLNTSSETKETKLTFREKFLIAAGSLTFLMKMMLIRHPELYREDSHSNLRNPNAGAVALEDNSIYGWADPVATQQLSSLNLIRKTWRCCCVPSLVDTVKSCKYLYVLKISSFHLR